MQRWHCIPPALAAPSDSSEKCGGGAVWGLAGASQSGALRAKDRVYRRFLRAAKPRENVGRGQAGGEGGIRHRGTVLPITSDENRRGFEAPRKNLERTLAVRSR